MNLKQIPFFLFFDTNKTARDYHKVDGTQLGFFSNLVKRGSSVLLMEFAIHRRVSQLNYS